MQEAERGAWAHPWGWPWRFAEGNGSGEKLELTQEARSGTSVLDPSQRHLPLNIRILWMDAKVAVTLDSKSASCTPVLRKAPADGLFSQ